MRGKAWSLLGSVVFTLLFTSGRCRIPSYPVMVRARIPVIRHATAGTFAAALLCAAPANSETQIITTDDYGNPSYRHILVNYAADRRVVDYVEGFDFEPCSPGDKVFVGQPIIKSRTQDYYRFYRLDRRSGEFETVGGKYRRVRCGSSGTAFVQKKIRGDWSLMDLRGKALTGYKFDDVRERSGVGWYVKKGDKWGIVDSSGAYSVEPRYTLEQVSTGVHNDSISVAERAKPANDGAVATIVKPRDANVTPQETPVETLLWTPLSISDTARLAYRYTYRWNDQSYVVSLGIDFEKSDAGQITLRTSSEEDGQAMEIVERGISNAWIWGITQNYEGQVLVTDDNLPMALTRNLVGASFRHFYPVPASGSAPHPSLGGVEIKRSKEGCHVAGHAGHAFTVRAPGEEIEACISPRVPLPLKYSVRTSAGEESVYVLDSYAGADSQSIEALEQSEAGIKHVSNEYASFRNEPDGFRGLAWGSSDESDLELARRESTPENTFETLVFRRPGENLQLGAADLALVEYTFRNGRFSSVSILIRSRRNIDALRDYLKDRHGPAEPDWTEGYLAWKGRKTYIEFHSHPDSDEAVAVIGSTQSIIDMLTEIGKQPEDDEALEDLYDSLFDKSD